MGSVDLETVPAGNAGAISATSTDGTSGIASTATSVPADSVSGSASTQTANSTGDSTNASTDSNASNMVTVGNKQYTTQQISDIVEKVGRFQGDRDRAEATFEKLVGGLRQAGFMVDRNFNILPIQQTPQPDKDQLTMLASAGDTDALRKLIEINKQETAQEVIGTIQAREEQSQALARVKADYPDFYNADGSLNSTSPLFKEAAKILDERPDLANPIYLPFIAEAAQGRLIKNNFKSVRQTITNQAHERISQGMGQTVQAPGSAGGNEIPTLTSEQAAYAKKFGVSDDRLLKIVERQGQGGYLL